jgi:hypothetical protein
MRRALLVPAEDVMNRIIEHGVVRRQNRTAGITKDHLDPFFDQTFPNDLCAGSNCHQFSC